MNIYLISQKENNDYDTYDSAVVVAPNEEVARRIHPSYRKNDFNLPYNTILPLDKNDFRFLNPKWIEPEDYYFFDNWAADVNKVKVELIGTTDLYDTEQVICASFNAG